MSEEHMEKLRQALIGAKKRRGHRGHPGALGRGRRPGVILQDAMASAMFTLGAMWSRGEVFLPEVVASATLFKMCNDLVEPALLASGGEKISRRQRDPLHGEGRPARPRQEHGRARCSRPPGSRSPTSARTRPLDKILTAVRETAARHPRDVGPADHDGAPAEGRDRGPQEGGPVRLDQGDGGRRAGHPGMGDEIGADGFAPDAPEAVSRAQALLGIEGGVAA